jgi:hypothetical protein
MCSSPLDGLNVPQTAVRWRTNSPNSENRPKTDSFSSMELSFYVDIILELMFHAVKQDQTGGVET